MVISHTGTKYVAETLETWATDRILEIHEKKEVGIRVRVRFRVGVRVGIRIRVRARSYRPHIRDTREERGLG